MIRNPKNRQRMWELFGMAGFIAFAVVLTSGLWLGGNNSESGANPQDQEFFQWNFAHAAHAVSHGENPFFTDLMNAPLGVNLMANTSVLLFGIPMAPITLWLGSHATFTIFVTVAFAGTAIAWYYFLSRAVVQSRTAAYIGAGFCGFAPGIVSHAGGQPNISAQFLVPLLLWCLLRLAQPAPATRRRRYIWRYGATLGGLSVAQVFLNEEILFFAGLATITVMVAYSSYRWSEAKARARQFFTGIGVALLVASPVLAAPLTFQFFGPQHYRGLPFPLDDHVADLGSYGGYARESLFGDIDSANLFSSADSEDNAFFGITLLLLVIALAVWMWRDMRMKLTAITAIVCFSLSLGSSIKFFKHDTHVPGPMAVLHFLPVFNLATITRYALIVASCVGVILAIGTDRVLREKSLPWLQKGILARHSTIAWAGILAIALVPVAPTPLPTAKRPPTPAFITEGMWRDYVTDDQTLLLAPMFVSGRSTTAMRWSMATDLELPIAHGYFLGPNARTTKAIWGSPARPTSWLLDRANVEKKIPKVTNKDRVNFQRDLKYWKVGIVAINPSSYKDGLVITLTTLLGPAHDRGGVLFWPITTDGTVAKEKS